MTVLLTRPATDLITGNALDVFREFLRLDAAAGDASPDTIRAYMSGVRPFARYCEERGPGSARGHVRPHTRIPQAAHR